jgi:hypothetical protein
MNRSIGTMREFKTKNFTVVADALPEDGLDLSWDEDGSVAKALESGEFMAFVARVRVYFRGEEIGSNYLGSCIYRSFDEFMDHRSCGRQNRQWEAEGEKGRCGSYFHQMISEAIDESRKHLVAIKQVHVRS